VSVVHTWDKSVKLQIEDCAKKPFSIRLCAAIFLAGQVWLHCIQGKICRRFIIEHMVTVGPGSISPVLLVNCFAGMIFTIQTGRELVRFGAVNNVGGAFALAFCRELAPILTASIIAGQVGSAFAAEIGAMQVTEQIDALHMLKTDPIDYLVIPRVIACCVMVPALTVFGLVIGIVGGAIAAFEFYKMSPDIFLESVRKFLTASDLLIVVFKGFIFGVMVAIIGCSWGLTTRGGVKEIGKSATAAVVTTWIAIFMLDLFLSLALFEKPVF
jgi:phospholipid/cholesterol/gamma-HCH transport system permease protein